MPGRPEVSSPLQSIVGTLAYLVRPSAGPGAPSSEVLMVRRTARQDDDAFGKVNGLGGKLEPNESVTGCLRRELREEAGIELTSFHLRGTITWSGFGPRHEDWLGFIFLVDGWEGEPPPSNEEGPLEWVPLPRLLQSCERPDPTLPMWAGDRHFVPLVFDADPSPFHGTMPYDADRPLNWSFERIGTACNT